MSLTEFLKGLAKGFMEVQKQRLEYEAKKLKKKAAKTAWAVGLSVLSVVFLVAGVIVLLSRWVALEWILIGAGILFAYCALLVNLSK